MHIVVISDTHELHRRVEVPPADLLICAGDFTVFSKSLSAIKDFDDWLGTLSHQWKLVVPGNHEFFLEEEPRRKSLISNATVLIDQAVELNGVKIYGSPMTPLYGGAFGKSREVDRVRHWAQVPEDVEVLITHGPPSGILDCAPGQSEHIGDPELAARIEKLDSLKLHCFGHVHSAYGREDRNGVVFINAALLGPSGDIDRAPFEFRLKA